MKVLLTMAFTLLASNVFGDCVTTRLGKTVCSNGQGAVAVNPKTGTVATAKKSPGGVTTAQTNTGAKAAYNPHTGNAARSANESERSENHPNDRWRTGQDQEWNGRRPSPEWHQMCERCELSGLQAVIGEHKEAWGFKPPRIRVNSVAYCPSPAFVTNTPHFLMLS
jgi:hypothetical protein